MKRLLFLFFFTTTQIAFSFNSNPSYAVRYIPDSLAKDANAVIRNYHKKYQVEDIGRATEKIRAVITIYNSKSAYDNLQVYYDNFTKVGKISATLYDESGKKIRTISKSEVDDYAAYDGFSIYNDSRFKHVDFTYGTYPYTIEYEYEVEHDGLQSYASWYPQQYKTGVEKSTFELILPSQMDFRHQSFNINNVPKISKTDKLKSYRWNLENLIALNRETYTPDTYQPLPVVYTLPNDFRVDGYSGNMETWQSFGLFMYELNKGRDVLSPAMTQKVKALTANATTDVEKITILYNYLKENMRYVSVQLGIGGWQTYDAAYVEKNKYGDCKALTNFMKAMLKVVGIEAHASLITSGDQRIAIKEDFTVPYFNHVILHVPSEDIWLECTSNMSPVNYLGSNTENRPTLLITKDGGILTKTPAIKTNQQIGKTTINLHSNGSATIKSATKLTGKIHEIYRGVKNSYSIEKQEKWFIKNQEFPTFDLNSFTLNTSDELPEANCDYQITVNRYASKAGKRLFVPLNLVNPLRRTLPKNKNRTQPLELDLAYEDEDEIIFKIPSDFKVESLPKSNQVIDTPYGSFSLKIEAKDNEVIYKRQLKIKAVEIPASEYDDLRNFYKEVVKMDNLKMVLVRKQA